MTAGELEFRAIDMAHGGSAVARLSGKAYFVDGVLPGELASGHVTLDKGSWGKIALDAILEPSPMRVEPRCRHFATCGGCQWQHGDYTAQLDWKRSIVAGQLAHLGRHPDPPVRETVAPGPPFGYRNRMDFRVASGRPALYEQRSRRLVPLTVCEILHPNLAEVFLDLGDISGVDTMTLRTSTTTGDVLIVLEGSVPPQALAWGCRVAVVEDGALIAVNGEPRLEETVADISFRVTGRAFFQNNTAGAGELVRLVTAAAQVTPEDTLLDAYAGGGLFAATVGQGAGRVIGIEVDETAAADLHSNLNRAGVEEFRIMRMAMEDAIESIDEYWDVAIADPPRQGLGPDGIAAVTAAQPRTLVYVSCDPASFARDTALLTEFDYQLDWVVPVDMFPQTFHIECVGRFVRID